MKELLKCAHFTYWAHIGARMFTNKGIYLFVFFGGEILYFLILTGIQSLWCCIWKVRERTKNVNFSPPFRKKQQKVYRQTCYQTCYQTWYELDTNSIQTSHSFIFKYAWFASVRRLILNEVLIWTWAIVIIIFILVWNSVKSFRFRIRREKHTQT